MLQVHGVSFRYGRHNAVLHSIDFDVASGEIVGLIGPNGSGKTTLIRLICDLYALQTGTIDIQGFSSSSPDAKAAVMHIGSNDDMPIFLTGWEYASTLARLYGVSLEYQKLAMMFEHFGMGGAEHRLIESYSHGMKKKMQLGCAFLLKRPLTIIDETLNGIDIDAWYTCINEFHRMRENGLSILLCSHDFALLEKTADSLALLRNGYMGQQVTLTDLMDEYGGIAEWYRTTLLEEAS
ncbi:ATP-binding cassette domain-containing protein [Bifidobacterium choloepi]|uniref:ABC transporter ATP-binding protein n=1 Tax=Bifidobacterium choloepi TaxID=2614131 RepID=A0A6I5MZZ6_9BIFI|nr:ABC transporter ATP-binding protein [Bifidobacterium choloepi]NEG69847.1 ABC transporter ATP-binding protein [Bifidobacterium choloepi]